MLCHYCAFVALVPIRLCSMDSDCYLVHLYFVVDKDMLLELLGFEKLQIGIDPMLYFLCVHIDTNYYLGRSIDFYLLQLNYYCTIKFFGFAYFFFGILELKSIHRRLILLSRAMFPFIYYII